MPLDGERRRDRDLRYLGDFLREYAPDELREWEASVRASLPPRPKGRPSVRPPAGARGRLLVVQPELCGPAQPEARLRRALAGSDG